MRRYIGKEPNISERREFIVFAWFPKKTNDGYWVWLEDYLSLREYIWVGGDSLVDTPTLCWNEYYSKIID